MTAIDARQFRRWQEEVARDPGSPAFVPLAEVYRREGRPEVARRLCTRGLERHPEHVEGHVLLGRLHREAGELDLAYDELDIALRLDPQHRAARRAIGYLCLERRDWSAAARHLESAVAEEPGDERAVRALALARGHLEAGAAAAGASLQETLAPLLDRFARDSRVRLVLLMEGSGRIIAQRGFTGAHDASAFASLGAGIQAASRALAGLLGQPAFEQLYQGEGESQLFLGPLTTPGGELILLSAFGEDTNIGLVRVHFETFAREAATLEWGVAPARRDAAGFEAELAAGLDRILSADGGPPPG